MDKTKTTDIKWIETHGVTAQGKREYIAFLKGETLTMRQRVLANCYQCCGMHIDGKRDCEMIDCALHVFMPYRRGGVMKARRLSDETIAKLRGRQIEKRPPVALASQ